MEVDNKNKEINCFVPEKRGKTFLAALFANRKLFSPFRNLRWKYFSWERLFRPQLKSFLHLSQEFYPIREHPGIDIGLIQGFPNF